MLCREFFLEQLLSFVPTAADTDDDRPHTLSADDLYKAHLVPYLLEAQSAISKRLETTESENVELVETINQQRDEINQLLGRLEGFIRDLSMAAQAIGKFDPNGALRREAENVLGNGNDIRSSNP